MKYIEIIIGTNILIHFNLVNVSCFLLREKKSKILVLLSSIFDGVYLGFYLFFPYELENFRYFIILLISIIPFINKGISKTLILSLVYLMLNFTLGGTAGILFNIMNHYSSVFISLGIMIILFGFYALYKKYHFRPDILEYDILIEDGNRKLYLNGFCDTGNFLSTEDNIPIVFVKNNIKIGRYFRTIQINSLSHTKEIPIYEVKSFKIKINNKYVKKDVYIAYGDIAFNVMFGSELLGG